MGKESLTHEEIACLLQCDGTDPRPVIDAGSAHGSKAETDEYADAISTDEEKRIVRLLALSEHLAYNLTRALSEVFRAATQVDVGTIDNVTYGEFLLRLDDPTCFVTLRTKDDHASFALNIELSILFPMIERMLGGELDTATTEQRPLTEIETRLAIRFVELFIDEWKAVSDPVDALGPEIVTVESNPCRAGVLACKEFVTCIAFEISLGQTQGTISLVIPRSMVENCTPSASDMRPHQASFGNGRSEDPVHVSVVLAETTLPAADVSGLQVGDMIDTGKGVDDPLEVTVDGDLGFEGKPGILDGHKAVRIEKSSVRETQ